ncbi:unnamed protein product, partial [Mesorhabditis belari]|uniref:Uncharacterized protein n=1 Tax=Mesorhabditis belari TaxID=2138241 RepID=A0AAF3F7W7_9BILA
MLTNSILNLTNTIIFYLVAIFLNLFFGDNLMTIFYNSIDFNQALLFNLFASIISVLCFRKPKEIVRSSGLKAGTVTVPTGLF